MLYREICRTLSIFLLGLPVALLLPLAIAIYCEWIIGPAHYPQPPCAFAFLITLMISLLLGFFFRFLGRKSSYHLYRKEAFVLILLVYIFVSLISALPFTLNKTFNHYLDAVFECVSGYTTTGATVMQAKRYEHGVQVPIENCVVAGCETNYSYMGTISPVIDQESGEVLLSGIEAVSPALLIWRSETQFLGGGGIVILFLALLPTLGVGGKVLFQTETTGPSKETMAPRIKETASQLWKIYVGLTLLQVILLLVTNREMPLFDALAISFSTLSTGGFAPKNANIAAYNNPYTEIVVMVFMLLGSLNFSLYFFCMKGRLSRLNDSELKTFFRIVIASSLFMALYLLGKMYAPLFLKADGTYSFWQSLRYGSFQAISAITSTGFFTANYDLWPFPAQTLMFILMFVGGMAGSTAGGMKVVRWQIFFRALQDKIRAIFCPDAIRPLRIGGKIVSESVVMTALCFLVAAALFSVSGTLFLIMDGVDPETALTTIGSMVNNAGLAFRMAGPEHSFAFLSDFGKVLCSLWMIAGRLEYFAVLVVLTPAFWRHA